MVRIEDGLFDLVNGPDIWTLMRVTNSHRGPSSGGGSGGGSSGKSRSGGSGNNYHKSTAKFCDHHGWCAHDTPPCKGSFAAGEKSKNFRAER